VYSSRFRTSTSSGVIRVGSDTLDWRARSWYCGLIGNRVQKGGPGARGGLVFSVKNTTLKKDSSTKVTERVGKGVERVRCWEAGTTGNSAAVQLDVRPTFLNRTYINQRQHRRCGPASFERCSRVVSVNRGWRRCPLRAMARRNGAYECAEGRT
jgi:hypothetical protein